MGDKLHTFLSEQNKSKESLSVKWQVFLVIRSFMMIMMTIISIIIIIIITITTTIIIIFVIIRSNI